MKKQHVLLALLAILSFSACTKSTDPSPVAPSTGDPQKGSKWTFKDTYYNQSGTITGTDTYSLIADTLTIAGSKWLILKESVTGQVAIGIQKRTDGWWWVPFPNPNASLWFKNPAVVGDKYNLNLSDYTTDTSKVMNINASVTVPAGNYTCTYIQSFDTNSMEDDAYFSATGPILVRTGTFDDKVPAGTGVYEKQRVELVSYTQ